MARFKDRNPGPLGQLGSLMELAHQSVIASAKRVGASQEALKICTCHLSSVTSLLNLLIKLRFRLNDENTQLLESCLSPLIDPDRVAQNDPLALGWEERTSNSLAHLLRQTSSKPSTSAQVSFEGSIHSIPSDTNKLQRHLTILCDRFEKGIPIIPN